MVAGAYLDCYTEKCTREVESRSGRGHHACQYSEVFAETASPLQKGGSPKGFIVSPAYCGGDGRTRTAVQTPHQAAFYTFSLSLVVGWQMPEDRPVPAYPLSLGRV